MKELTECIGTDGDFSLSVVAEQIIQTISVEVCHPEGFFVRNFSGFTGEIVASN